MVDGAAIFRMLCPLPGNNVAMYMRGDRAVRALLGKHRERVDRDAYSGADSGKANDVPASAAGNPVLPGMKPWMRSHQSMEQRQITSTLVNMAVVLS
eukprot:6603346-Pyramimonas_sp.AAC.1